MIPHIIVRQVLKLIGACRQLKCNEVQITKESACLIAIRAGFALIRRGLTICALYPCGRVDCISESEFIEDVWFDVLSVIDEYVNSVKYN